MSDLDKLYGRLMVCGKGYGEVDQAAYAELESLVAQG